MTWTNPGDGQSLDLTTGQLVTETHWDALRRNLDFLGGADGYSGTVRRLTVVTKTANYTATNTDDVILVDASGGPVTITLPTAVGIAGRVYHFKRLDSSGNVVTVDPNGSETIDGAATATLAAQQQTLSLVSDGANWRRVDQPHLVVPAARVYHSANQSIPNTTDTPLAFNSERWDTHGFHDTVTNNTRLTIPTGLDGLYLIMAHAAWAANATGTRSLSIRGNGTTFFSALRVTGVSAEGTLSVSTITRLSAGDYVEAIVSQSSGGALDVNASPQYSPEFMLVRLGP